jgi:hypothetical protein
MFYSPFILLSAFARKIAMAKQKQVVKKILYGWSRITKMPPVKKHPAHQKPQKNKSVSLSKNLISTFDPPSHLVISNDLLIDHWPVCIAKLNEPL